MILSSRSTTATLSGTGHRHERNSRDPPPLPASRVSKRIDEVAAVNSREQLPGSTFCSSTTDGSRPASVATASTSGQCQTNDDPILKISRHHQWITQIQNAVRSATSGRYRKERRAVSIENPADEKTAAKKFTAVSTSLDRLVIKRRKHHKAIVTPSVSTSVSADDSVIRSQANEYHAIRDVASVIVDVKPPRGEIAATTSTEHNISSTRRFSAKSRDPSPMASSGYASDGIYAFLKHDELNEETRMHRAEGDIVKRSSRIKPLPMVIDSRVASKTPSNSVPKLDQTSGKAMVSGLASCIPPTGSSYDVKIQTSRRKSPHLESSSSVYCSRYRKKPVYDTLLNQACGMVPETSERRRSLPPGTMQLASNDAATRRQSLGCCNHQRQPAVLEDITITPSNDEHETQRSADDQNQVDEDDYSIDDTVIYENDALTSRSSLANQFMSMSMTSQFDKTTMSPVYENEMSTTLVYHDETLPYEDVHRSAFLSFHTAPERSPATTSFRFRSPLPVLDFDTSSSLDVTAGGARTTADWDDRLSTLSLGCRRRNHRASQPETIVPGHRDRQVTGNDFDERSQHRDAIISTDHQGRLATRNEINARGEKHRRSRSGRRRLLFGARMQPEDRSVESVDADLEPIDRDFLKQHLSQPITNLKLAPSFSLDRLNSWFQETSRLIQSTGEHQRTELRHSDNIYESIVDLASSISRTRVSRAARVAQGEEDHIYSNVHLPFRQRSSSAYTSPPPPLPPPPVPARRRESSVPPKRVASSGSLPSLYELPLCPTEIVDLDSDHVYTIGDVLASFRALAAHLPRAERFVAELQASARASASIEHNQQQQPRYRQDGVEQRDADSNGERSLRRRCNRTRHFRNNLDEQRSKVVSSSVGASRAAAEHIRSRSAECNGVEVSQRQQQHIAAKDPLTSSSKTVTVGRRKVDMLHRGPAVSSVSGKWKSRDNLTAIDTDGDDPQPYRHHHELVCSPGNDPRSPVTQQYVNTRQVQCREPEVATTSREDQTTSRDRKQVLPESTLGSSKNSDKENVEVRSSIVDGGEQHFVRRSFFGSSLRYSKKFLKAKENQRLNSTELTSSRDTELIAPGPWANNEIRKPFQTLPTNVKRHADVTTNQRSSVPLQIGSKRTDASIVKKLTAPLKPDVVDWNLSRSSGTKRTSCDGASIDEVDVIHSTSAILNKSVSKSAARRHGNNVLMKTTTRERNSMGPPGGVPVTTPFAKGVADKTASSGGEPMAEDVESTINRSTALFRWRNASQSQREIFC